MKIFKKTALFLLVLLLLCMALPLSALASDTVAESVTDVNSDGKTEDAGGDKLDMNLKPEPFEDRLSYALQGTITGIVMVFAVLTLLSLILYGSKFIFYDLPNRKKEIARPIIDAKVSGVAPQAAVNESNAVTVAEQDESDDGTLAAVITAAIAATLSSEEYKNEFVGGFRVVSFKRASGKAWNKK